MWEALKTHRFIVLAAGRRFGKTILAIITLLIEALSHNDSLYWYVAPSYRQAKMIAWKMLKTFAIFFNPKFNESELSATFPNGAVIELKGADNEDALRGVGLWGMVIDEFASIYDNWSVWHEVLRPSLADKKGWAMFIGTPKGKDAFFELFMKGMRGDDGWQSFQYKTTDNHCIPDIDAEVAEAKRSMPERYFRQEFEASFEDFVGLIYPEFSKIHIVKPHYVQTGYNRLGAIDPAISGTTGVLKAFIDEDGNVIIYSEYYKKNVRVSEVSNEMREENVKWVIDPASKAKLSQREGEMYSLYDEYRENGITAYPAENDVEAGINRVGEKFISGEIKIFSTCTNLIWELERYHWSDQKETVKGITKATPYKKDDHLCDCLKYIIMARGSKSDLTLTENLSELSPLFKMQEAKKLREMQGG